MYTEGLEQSDRRYDLELLEVMAILAPIYVREGAGRRAEELARTVVAKRKLLLGTADSQSVQAMELLAEVYISLGQFSRASDVLMEAMTSQHELQMLSLPTGASPTEFVLGVCWPAEGPENDPSRPLIAEMKLLETELAAAHVGQPQLELPRWCHWQSLSDVPPP
jgi:hypothetical protein